uniref:Gag protein n=2 Tax=Drosophila ananassae TaxID=7217 RepID=V9H1F7_DROAN|nr:gag protein - fruit fly (Drosophila ananassae) transposon Tom [Drosophila ananassae]CAA80823.1 gag protein [Drosophila ananassae]
MAQPAQPENTLNESNLAEARGQLKDVPPFRGEPETLFTFISRVDYILSLYHTNDVRQQRILLGAIERNIEGHVTRTLGLPTIEDWPTLRSRMINEYKPQAPNYKLLENFRETPYKGNLRAFCEEAERRRQILISKLHLEGNQSNLIIYLQAVRDSMKTLVRKLPIQLFTILAHHDIPDLRSLINIAQNEGIYEEHINFETNKNIEIKNKTPNFYQNPKAFKNYPINQSQYQPRYPQYPHPLQPNFNPYMHAPRPIYTQQLSNNQPMGPGQTYPGPNRYMNPQPIFNRIPFPKSNFNLTPQTQQPRMPSNPNFPLQQTTKRPRPSDSEQTKMSIDELRLQEAQEYEQNYQQPYEQEYYDYTQYQDQTYEEQCQAPINQDQAEINFDENFQSPAPEDTNT